MNYKIYITTLLAIIVLYLGSMFIILNSKVVNKDTISNEFKGTKAKKGSQIVLDLVNDDNDTIIKEKKKFRIFKRKNNN